MNNLKLYCSQLLFCRVVHNTFYICLAETIMYHKAIEILIRTVPVGKKCKLNYRKSWDCCNFCN